VTAGKSCIRPRPFDFRDRSTASDTASDTISDTTVRID
jgi:hypothetical protein